MRLLPALAAALTSLAQSTVTPVPLQVAILHANGTLIPIATYDGGRWSNTWPAHGVTTATQPQTLAEIPRQWSGGAPLPRTWWLWLPTRSSHTITLQAPRFAVSACSPLWSVTTSFPAGATPPHTCPVKTVGVALSREMAVEVPWPTRGSEMPMDLIERAFNEAEAKARRADATPVDNAARKAVPIRIERAWHFSSLYDGEPLMYVEAVRTYPQPVERGIEVSPTRTRPLIQDGCGGITAYRAWIRGPNIISETLTLVDCDMKGATFVTPLGAFRLDGQRYVVVASSGWEHEEHGILRIDAGSIAPVAMLQTH